MVNERNQKLINRCMTDGIYYQTLTQRVGGLCRVEALADAIPYIILYYLSEEVYEKIRRSIMV